MIIEFLSQTWAWYVSGPLIALIMLLLLWAGGQFGVSSTLRSMCAIGGAGKQASFFDYNWRAQIWNLVFIAGAVIGGFIAHQFLQNPDGIQISNHTVNDLEALGILFDGQLAPKTIFSWSNVLSLQGVIIMILGGFFIGFGTRWAGGCTSGHAISGLSNLQLPSLIAVVGFFLGGLLMTHFLFPLIFS